jgi:pyrroloquinoline-quinone synthase
MSNPSTATISAQCDALVAEHALLQHPFYLAWSDGTLPVPALRDYAREYGAFIARVGAGWATAGERTIARIEDGHARVWQHTFAAGLGANVGRPIVPAAAALVETAQELFAERPTALGALYAFEIQQPRTARSKLDGLRAHYPQLPAACGEYFKMHVDDDEEPALLARQLETLSEDEKAQALAACERMAIALYDALSGIHSPYAGHGCEGKM